MIVCDQNRVVNLGRIGLCVSNARESKRNAPPAIVATVQQQAKVH